MAEPNFALPPLAWPGSTDREPRLSLTRNLCVALDLDVDMADLRGISDLLGDRACYVRIASRACVYMSDASTLAHSTARAYGERHPFAR
jgi:hypothetical protein